ncbi:MAG TPA: PQQ-binding-like beta-propeller repeat protein [Candidatus Lokiarchaeia archaeon]|nr:PQQ-binding-like beta-propeller repeat protein [Candidatus Lokiarchaeia archaeon]
MVAVFAICTGISFCAFMNVQVKEAMPIAFNLNVPSPASALGSSDPVGDEWPMFHGALNHTGVATTTPMFGSGPSWIYNTSTFTNWIESSPAVSGGRLFVGSDQSHKVYCLNASTGALLWSYTTGNWVRSSPAVAGGRVYVGSDDHDVYCLNATTGLRLWVYTTGDIVYSSPAVVDGRVYVGSLDKKIYCLNATTGALIWSYTASEQIYVSSPAIAAGRLFVGVCNNKLFCLNATTGTFIWAYTTSSWVESSPAYAYGRVYVGSMDNNIYCLNASTGALIWCYTTGNGGSSSPAIESGCVYVGGLDKKIYCLNATTGASVWNYTTYGIVQASPVVASGRMYVGSGDGKVYCLNATTGEFIWSYFTTSSGIDSSAAIANGHMYVGGGDASLYCLPMIFPPSAPRNLQASGESKQVVLAWQTPAGNGGSPIVNYNIYRGTSAGIETMLTNIGNVTTWTDTLVASGQTYYYEVSAVSNAGEGPRSNEANATALAVPLPPCGLVASAGNGQVVLEWQSPASNGGAAIKNYTIYRGTSPGGETNLTTIGNVTTWTDTGVANGQTYYYKASATNAVGEGPLSIEADATPLTSITSPSAPQNLQATSGNSQVALSWQAPVNNGGSAIIFYKIYRGKTPGGEVLVATIGNVTAFSDSNLTNGQPYYYEVSATNGAGEGMKSSETRTAPATVPKTPQSLLAMAGDNQVALAWQVPAYDGGSPITGYRIYQGTMLGSEQQLTTIGNVTAYTSTGLTNGQVYYFKVAAVNSVGTSTNSTEARATPATLPDAPVGLMLTPGSALVMLNWAAPSSNGGSAIIGFRIYQGTMPDGETLLATIGNKTAYNATSLINGQIYYFKVCAVNTLGAGANSTETSVVPATVPGMPRNLRATYGNKQVTLGWQAPGNNGGAAITNYKIYRGTMPGEETLLAVVSNATAFDDTGLTSGQATYYYEISAVNAAGEGNRTGEAVGIGHPPVGSFNLTESIVYINAPVTFNGTAQVGDSPIVAWSWSFGDGSSAATRNITHAYAEPGTYTITLAVLDGNGFKSNATMIITVVAITSRQGLMGITAGLIVIFSAGAVISVKLRKKSLKRDWIES